MASKPTLQRVQASILDPMLSDNYLLEIPNIPVPGDKDQLTLQCKSVSKPGRTINSVEVQVFGHTIEYASNVTFGHDMSVSYYENAKGEVSSLLEDWSVLTKDPASQLGEYKNTYARNGIVTLFDQKGLTVMVYKVWGIWPSQIPDLSLDGSSSSALTVDMTFKYDWVEIIKNANR